MRLSATKYSILLFILFQPAAALCQEILDSVDNLISAQYALSKRVESGFFNDALTAAKAALETAENRFGPTHLSVTQIQRVN